MPRKKKEHIESPVASEHDEPEEEPSDEEEASQDEQPIHTKRESKYRPPTAAEMRQYEETQMLFQTNIMKMQV